MNDSMSVSASRLGHLFEYIAIEPLFNLGFDIIRTGCAHDRGVDFRGKIRNSINDQFVEVIGQCKYRSSSICPQRKLSLKELDRISSTVHLESNQSVQCSLGVILSNVSLTTAAMKHFKQRTCSPLLFIQMDVDDALLCDIFGMDQTDMDHDGHSTPFHLDDIRLRWTQSEMYKSLRSGHYHGITQMMINSSVTNLLPNASVSRVLGSNHNIYHFMC